MTPLDEHQPVPDNLPKATTTVVPKVPARPGFSAMPRFHTLLRRLVHSRVVFQPRTLHHRENVGAYLGKLPPSSGRRVHRSRTAARRAALCILWAAIVFACAQATIGLSVSAGVVTVQDLIYADKVALLEKARARFDHVGEHGRPLSLLAMGSSRTLGGLDAGRVEKHFSEALGRPALAFNFGIPAAGPLTTNLYLRRIVESGLRPDFVLIEVLPPFLAGHLKQPGEARWLQPHRIRASEFELLDALGYHLPRDTATGWQRWVGPSYLYRSALMTQGLPTWVPFEQISDLRKVTDAHGWAPRREETLTAEQHEQGLSNSWHQYAPVLIGFQLGGPAPAALRDVLNYCRAAQLPAALLLMPEGSDFRSWYSPEARAQIETFLHRLHVEFDVPIMDARLWIQDSDFADGHHLLLGGARRFTDRLAAELRTMPRFLVRGPVAASLPREN